MSMLQFYGKGFLRMNGGRDRKRLAASQNDWITMATIDIGAHSARLLIAEVKNQTRTFTPLEELERPVPLGSNVFRNGEISNESIQYLCGILTDFREKMQEYGVTLCKAIATSAVREASNADIFLERIRHATGIEVQLFTGTDEARLDFTAVSREIPRKYGFFESATLIADIGTGACEISTYERGNLCFTETLKIGTLRLMDQIHGTYSASAINYYTSRMIDNAFSELHSVSANLKADFIIAMGSSARNLLKLLPGKSSKPAAVCISKEEFFLLRSRISDLTFEQLGKEYNLSADLAETIHPCCMILDNLLRLTDAGNILIPMTSTKFLLLQDFIDKIFGVPDRFEEQIHSLIMRTAARYRCDNDYCERTTQFAEVLFDKLEKLHGLGHAELLILKIAARLHKAGLFINNQSYHEHSGYIIRNTEIPGISVEQRRLAALVARYHRKEPPQLLQAEYAALPVRDREVVNKLAAILRIACALGALAATPGNLRVKIEPGQVTIRLGDDIACFPETMTDMDTAYFRSVYACRIHFA